MKNFSLNKGNGLAWLIVIVAIIIVLALVFTSGNDSPEDNSAEANDDSSINEDGAMMDEEAPADGILESGDFKLVTYTDKGFEPKELTIKEGETVRFVNNSGNEMWIGSAKHPDHVVYSGTPLEEHCDTPGGDGESFDQCEASPAGSFWEFTFDKVGEWGYHNHVKSADWGRIIVE